MVNTEIRLIIFFAAKDGEALYSSVKYTTTNAKEAEVEWFYEDLQHFLRTTTKK